MTTAELIAFPLPEKHAEAAEARSRELPNWDLALTFELPAGYHLHPASLEALRDRLVDRAALVSDLGGRFIDVLCTAHGESVDDARADARVLAEKIREDFGLPREAIVELNVTVFESVEEILERRRGDDFATVIHLESQ